MSETDPQPEHLAHIVSGISSAPAPQARQIASAARGPAGSPRGGERVSGSGPPGATFTGAVAGSLSIFLFLLTNPYLLYAVTETCSAIATASGSSNAQAIRLVKAYCLMRAKMFRSFSSVILRWTPVMRFFLGVRITKVRLL